MNNPDVSIIIPAYNGATFIADTIQSVLDQTYPHFELIIVDDASPDQTKDVVGQFKDPRVKYLLHDTNKGSTVARRTGLQASSGEIIAYLDQDDLFHPEKIQLHVEAYKNDPDVGFTYNSFFDLEHSSKRIRELRRPRDIGLADLVLGFPIPPSSWVMRRNWAFFEELWDETTFLHGSEIVHLGRLYLAGCKFQFIDKALQYRWYQSGRIYRDLRGKSEAEINCQKMIFSDHRCPSNVRDLQDIAIANIYLMWADLALLQSETELAQEYLRRVIQLNPAIVKGNPCHLVRHWVLKSIADENADHEMILKNMFAQLPPELVRFSDQYEWAVGQGYLEKGTRAVYWSRVLDGKHYFAQAGKLGVQIDDIFLMKLTYQLANYEHEFGSAASWEILANLAPLLEQIDGKRVLRRLMGNFHLNAALRDYGEGKYDLVPQKVMAAISNNPAYLVNRGAISILLRSSFSRKVGNWIA